MSRKYSPEDLYESIISEQSIICDVCSEENSLYNIDDIDACEVFFEEGWRATPNRVYCPVCAKEKLK